MSWWGKVVGGAFGFMLGGPLGAVLGATLGHQFDRGLSNLEGDFLSLGSQERVQAAFFTATFSVMGHLAKADGRVSEGEIAVAKNLMAQMQLNDAQRKAAIELFNTGKQPGFPLEESLEQLRVECHHRTTLLQMFLEIQVQAALADGRLHAAERETLNSISDQLRFPPNFIEEILRFIRGTSHAGRDGGRPAGRVNLQDAYDILGVGRSATDADLKKAYRRLMNQHHPDKLVAKGLPDEMMKLATEKTQKIQKAYDLIRESRKAA